LGRSLSINFRFERIERHGTNALRTDRDLLIDFITAVQPNCQILVNKESVVLISEILGAYRGLYFWFGAFFKGAVNKR
jgi:hypothetical protein